MPEEPRGEPVPAPDPTADDPGTPAPSPSAPTDSAADAGYTSAGVPTFDSVREKIETRYGTALGAAELAAETPEGRTVEEQYEARQDAAREKLEQIRASMHAEADREQP
jgi:phage shock protein A